MRKQVHDQEMQEEREAKQRVKDELLNALVRETIFERAKIVESVSAAPGSECRSSVEERLGESRSETRTESRSDHAEHGKTTQIDSTIEHRSDLDSATKRAAAVVVERANATASLRLRTAEIRSSGTSHSR